MDKKNLINLWPLIVVVFDLVALFNTPSPPEPTFTMFNNHLHPPNSNQTRTVNHTAAATPTPTPTPDLNHQIHLNQNLTQLANLNQTNNGKADNNTKYEGNNVVISHSTLCSYRGTAMSVKLMLANKFPGMKPVLSHYPPKWSKYLVLKLIPILQIGVIIIVMAGPVLFHAWGSTTPSWYHPLSNHKFAAIAIPWLLGSILINYIQNTEPFEIYLNDQLVFCKQLSGRFPGPAELLQIFSSRVIAKG